MRALAIVFASLVVACSGPEERAEPTSEGHTRADEPDPPPPDPSAEPPAAECTSDADCEVVEECCACPRWLDAMTHEEAAAVHERCARVRCAACALPAPPAGQTAGCEAGQCVLRGATGASSAPCGADADCAVHVPCCTCPAEPVVMHVDDIEANRRSCAARSCMACDRPFTGPTPVAACRDGACVDARP
ncbi:MAG: hypothetical protein KC619_14280 [Myxococcales bacterium]|nr:hypothetical protein [Myxococcales bacterium]